MFKNIRVDEPDVISMRGEITTRIMRTYRELKRPIPDYVIFSYMVKFCMEGKI